MRFTTVIEQGSGTTTGIVVPPEVLEALDAGKRPAVTVTVNGHTYRSSVATMGGRSMVSVSAAVREASGVRGGDEVEVDLVLDTAPRTVEVPADLAAALDPHPVARRFFDALPYSQQRWFVLGIEGAKAPATRQRRVDAAVERLREGRGQR